MALRLPALLLIESIIALSDSLHEGRCERARHPECFCRYLRQLAHGGHPDRSQQPGPLGLADHHEAGCRVYRSSGQPRQSGSPPLGGGWSAQSAAQDRRIKRPAILRPGRRGLVADAHRPSEKCRQRPTASQARCLRARQPVLTCSDSTTTEIPRAYGTRNFRQEKVSAIMGQCPTRASQPSLSRRSAFSPATFALSAGGSGSASSMARPDAFGANG